LLPEGRQTTNGMKSRCAFWRASERGSGDSFNGSLGWLPPAIECGRRRKCGIICLSTANKQAGGVEICHRDLTPSIATPLWPHIGATISARGELRYRSTLRAFVIAKIPVTRAIFPPGKSQNGEKKTLLWEKENNGEESNPSILSAASFERAAIKVHTRESRARASMRP